jgi:hypothetical protein
METQERMTPSFQRLRRRIHALSDRATDMATRVETLKNQGHFPGLDPHMREDTTQLRAMVGDTLPAGMRESLFHRINFPHIVAGLPEEYVNTPRTSVRGRSPVSPGALSAENGNGAALEVDGA